MDTYENVKGAAHWACYFINGDCSGMEDSEIAEADAWYDNLGPGAEVIDCGEPFFSNEYGWHTGTKFRGGDLVEYVVAYRGLR